MIVFVAVTSPSSRVLSPVRDDATRYWVAEKLYSPRSPNVEIGTVTVPAMCSGCPLGSLSGRLPARVIERESSVLPG